MASTQILTKGGARSNSWLAAIKQVRDLAGWSPAKKILVWVDNGNSWVKQKGGKLPDADVVAEQYDQIAEIVPEIWEMHLRFVRSEAHPRLG